MWTLSSEIWVFDMRDISLPGGMQSRQTTPVHTFRTVSIIAIKFNMSSHLHFDSTATVPEGCWTPPMHTQDRLRWSHTQREIKNKSIYVGSDQLDWSRWFSTVTVSLHRLCSSWDQNAFIQSFGYSLTHAGRQVVIFSRVIARGERLRHLTFAQCSYMTNPCSWIEPSDWAHDTVLRWWIQRTCE